MHTRSWKQCLTSSPTVSTTTELTDTPYVDSTSSWQSAQWQSAHSDIRCFLDKCPFWMLQITALAVVSQQYMVINTANQLKWHMAVNMAKYGCEDASLSGNRVLTHPSVTKDTKRWRQDRWKKDGEDDNNDRQVVVIIVLATDESLWLSFSPSPGADGRQGCGVDIGRSLLSPCNWWISEVGLPY